MSRRVLIVCETWHVPLLMRVIDRLSLDEHLVFLRASTRYSGLYGDEFVESCNREQYDAVVWMMHVGAPDMMRAVIGVRSQLRYVIDHDMLGVRPEGADPAFGCTRTMTFTRRHHDVAVARGAPRVTPVRPLLTRDDSPDHPGRDQRVTLFWSGRFDPSVVPPFACDVKRFSAYEQLPWWASYAPMCAVGTQGLQQVAASSRYWASRESGALVDAVAVGCLPIMYDAPYVKPWLQCGVRGCETVCGPLKLFTIDHEYAVGDVTTHDVMALDARTFLDADYEETTHALRAYYFHDATDTVASVLLEDLASLR